MPWPVHPNGLLGAQGDSDSYQISRSLRFNSADSAYLNRTPASAGNQKTWTWSSWVKIGNLSTERIFLSNTDTSGRYGLYCGFRIPNTFEVGDYGFGSYDWVLTTTQLFRDTSSWYHIIVSVDTTQSTASNRVRVYLNGNQITSFSASSYPSQNSDLRINSTSPMSIGRVNNGSYFFDGYLTEINFIDGQALTPSSFGKTDTVTGRWKAQAYSGTYGANGFYLGFKDNTSTTTLGYDDAGSNDWTLNNFSVTAGTGNDSLVDSPTNYGTDTGVGGTVRGNYATFNPLSITSGSFVQGNLRYTGPSGWRRANGTIAVSSGKWYWEVTLGNAPFGSTPADSFNAFGWGLSTVFASSTSAMTITDAVILADNQHYKNFSGSATSLGTSFSSGDVLGCAVDLGANTFTFYRNGSQLVTGTIGGTSGRELVPIIISYDGTYGVMDCNFGQRSFAYTAPSGFKALCTTNLIKATAITTSGSFVGNVSADGPFVYLNGIPTAMTINGNAVTFGSEADKLSNGFKVRTTSTSYNSTGTNNFSVSTTAQKFKYARAQAN
jgi:hypothetical protein